MDPFTHSSAPTQSARKARFPVRTAFMLALMVFVSSLAGVLAGSLITTRNFEMNALAQNVISGQPVAQFDVIEAANAASIYRDVGASVVEINVIGGSGRFTTAGNGSGVIVSPEGYILTNAHVVAGGERISVQFADGSMADAELIGSDSGNDLAVIRVALHESATVAQLGDSDSIAVGDTVIAIGSPFGLEQSVTQGIISAVARDWQPGRGRTQRDLIQTDAPINPGNSGGPLFNTAGEVIGINSMIESPISGSVGVGFAIPINTAKALLPDLEAGATLEPAWLGISGQDSSFAVAAGVQVPVETGVVVMSIVPGSPAEEAGLTGGDVIVAVEGINVADMTSLVGELAKFQPDDRVTLSINRNGSESEIAVTLGRWPQQ